MGIPVEVTCVKTVPRSPPEVISRAPATVRSSVIANRNDQQNGPTSGTLTLTRKNTLQPSGYAGLRQQLRST
jgi:hypothetical protein